MRIKSFIFQFRPFCRHIYILSSKSTLGGPSYNFSSSSFTSNLHQQSHSHKNSQVEGQLIKNNRWDLFASLVLERVPVVTSTMTSLESEYSTLLSKYEAELSKKSDHELRKEKDS
jgi:hypothetical protein